MLKVNLFNFRLDVSFPGLSKLKESNYRGVVNKVGHEFAEGDMLEPRQADLPALFLVLVVLPVVVYILLGRWSEASKRKERIELLAGEGPVESYRAEAMASASVIPPSFIPPSVIPPAPPPNAAIKVCARCNAPATTRCSRCKSVRYCSGKCQIIHWRQGHKDECRPPADNDLSVKSASSDGAGLERGFCQEDAYFQFIGRPSEQLVQGRAQFNVESQEMNPCAAAASSATVGAPQISKPERRISEKRVSRKSTKEMPDGKTRAANVSNEGSSRKISINSEASARNKLRGNGSINSEDGFSEMPAVNDSAISNGSTDWESVPRPNLGVKSHHKDSLCSTKRGMNTDEVGTEYAVPIMNGFRQENNCCEEVLKKSSFAEMVSSNGNTRSRSVLNTECVKPGKCAKSIPRVVREKAQATKMRKGHASDEPVTGMGNFTAGHGSNGATGIGLMKVIGLKKSSKISRLDASELCMGSCQKVQVLFPYEEFTKFFNHEVFELTPRGLLNCGNSCYANAVLQCLTCTKPLVTYLLSGAHSRACCLKNWCLLCELEQHVMMLREPGGPLSPSRILTHIRSISSQIGDGSQEDAHEFLRLLVASMQSICLEEVGGENQVHPSLQETTFIQQTFGGRLRSMVKCLKCLHESERYENIMDLTLEIYGWVESLEDALTQFTTPEDLDGENMYRCGRCASYVRARKQLSIDEAPNILTIVLKRFQEGNYGKINKCITFPEMLDMVPFMTGTNDIPPLYMLYGVVVHVDTLNASFSGHYVSYVKDLQGNWFRIDDSVVQSVPTSQVMSEGAYILFYMRSSPRPPRVFMRKPTGQQAAKPSRPRTRSSSDVGQTIHRSNNRYTPSAETYAEPNPIQFSDPASSDWSLFTSSDDASFTSESTRDSFSTTDYSDTCNIDPFSSVFSSAQERPSQRTISCRMFSGSKPVTRYVSEEKGFVQIGGDTGQVSDPFDDAFLSDRGYKNFVNYESHPGDDFLWTFSNCHL